MYQLSSALKSKGLISGQGTKLPCSSRNWLCVPSQSLSLSFPFSSARSLDFPRMLNWLQTEPKEKNTKAGS
jgi:hypothetical protein